jgi:hypothetical protein
MTSCGGERHCVLFIGTERDASLRVMRTGSTYTGVLTVYSQPVAVSGVMTPDGELTLTGRKTPAIAADLEIEVTALRVKLVDGATTGVLEYVVRGMPVGAWVFGDVRHAGQITSAQRVVDAARFDEAQFGGSWHGRFVVRQCSWVAWLWCYPYEDDRVHFFQLDLTQTGNEVAGMFRLSPLEVPVTGRVTGGVLELTGEHTRVISGGSEVARLRSWSSRRDLFGSMTGTFSFELTWPGIGDGSRLYSTTYHSAEIVSTVLVN